MELFIGTGLKAYLKKYSNHYGNNLLGYIMEYNFPIDIDYPEDLEKIKLNYKIMK